MEFRYKETMLDLPIYLNLHLQMPQFIRKINSSLLSGVGVAVENLIYNWTICLFGMVIIKGII